MKVILLRDVAKIGRRSQVVSVSDGYALNKLIPEKAAVLATEANIKHLAKEQEKKEHNVEALYKKIDLIEQQFATKPLMIKVNANEQGHLFQAVSSLQVIEAAKKASVEINPKWIAQEAPIKNLGEHTIRLKLDSREWKLSITVKL
jgi:large subunit ribosomal protein L9